MVRRLSLLGLLFLTLVSFGCSTAADYQAGQAGQFQSENLWPTEREWKAGDR
jgi:hypothetical protein